MELLALHGHSSTVEHSLSSPYLIVPRVNPSNSAINLTEAADPSASKKPEAKATRTAALEDPGGNATAIRSRRVQQLAQGIADGKLTSSVTAHLRRHGLQLSPQFSQSLAADCLLAGFEKGQVSDMASALIREAAKQWNGLDSGRVSNYLKGVASVAGSHAMKGDELKSFLRDCLTPLVDRHIAKTTLRQVERMVLEQLGREGLLTYIDCTRNASDPYATLPVFEVDYDKVSLIERTNFGNAADAVKWALDQRGARFMFGSHVATPLLYAWGRKKQLGAMAKALIDGAVQRHGPLPPARVADYLTAIVSLQDTLVMEPPVTTFWRECLLPLADAAKTSLTKDELGKQVLKKMGRNAYVVFVELTESPRAETKAQTPPPVEREDQKAQPPTFTAPTPLKLSGDEKAFAAALSDVNAALSGLTGREREFIQLQINLAAGSRQESDQKAVLDLARTQSIQVSIRLVEQMRANLKDDEKGTKGFTEHLVKSPLAPERKERLKQVIESKHDVSGVELRREAELPVAKNPATPPEPESKPSQRMAESLPAKPEEDGLAPQLLRPDSSTAPFRTLAPVITPTPLIPETVRRKSISGSSTAVVAPSLETKATPVSNDSGEVGQAEPEKDRADEDGDREDSQAIEQGGAAFQQPDPAQAGSAGIENAAPIVHTEQPAAPVVRG